MKEYLEIYPEARLPCSFRMPLHDVVFPALTHFLGYSVQGLDFSMLLHQVPEKVDAHGFLANMAPDYGYATLVVYAGNQRIYRHPHPLTELLTWSLPAMLRRQDPEISRWGFRIGAPDLGELPLAIPTPPVAGLAYGGHSERSRLRVRRLEEAPPPSATLADFGLLADETLRSAAVKVVLHPEVKDYLTRDRPFSDQVEEGGFLTGRLFADGDQPGTHLVELCHAPDAHHTGASLLHLTFTGDSFTELKRSLPEDRSRQRLLGWYHTHLFPAREAMGLSSIDLDLHFTTFRQPWQLAGLINLEPGGRRVLRFYVRRDNTMIACPFRVLQHQRCEGGA